MLDNVPNRLKMPFEMNIQCKVNEVLKDLAACDCCEKHKKNRPTKWGPWVELPYHDTSVHDDPESCRCPCRHNARILCRMHPDTNPSWDHATAMCRQAEQLVSWHAMYLEDKAWYDVPTFLQYCIGDAAGAKRKQGPTEDGVDTDE